MSIKRDGSYGVMAQELFRFGNARDRGFWALVVFEAAEGVVGQTSSLSLFRLLEPLALAIKDEFGVLNEGHAICMSELFSASADEVNVRALLEDETRGLNRIAEALYAGDSSCLHSSAIHDKRIKLDATVRGEEASPASIKGGIVFHNCNCSLDCVDRSAAASKHGVSGLKGVTNTGFMGSCSILGNCPCSAVDNQNWFLRGSSHPVMVDDGPLRPSPDRLLLLSTKPEPRCPCKRLNRR